MKKFLVLLLALVFIAGLMGCPSQKTPPPPAPEKQSQIVPPPLPLTTALPESTLKPENPTAPAVELAPIPAGTRKIEITAPAAVSEIWKGWHGKYKMFIHRDKPAADFKDLAGRAFLCAFINSDSIVGDVNKLCAAGGIKFNLSIQNNPEIYKNNFLEDSNQVGILVSAVANQYNLSKNPKLVEVVIK